MFSRELLLELLTLCLSQMDKLQEMLRSSEQNMSFSHKERSAVLREQSLICV
jgi:hypothetical protein